LITLSRELDLYADIEEFLITRGKDSSLSSTISLFDVEYYNMDCSHARKWKFMFAVSGEFIHCDQEFLSSIEYGKISTGTDYFSFEVNSSTGRSNSSVSIDGSHPMDNDRRRISRERKGNPIWCFVPPASNRLTEQDITDFVNCVKECAFIAIFTKTHLKEAAKACQYLSMLRPELIVPPIVEKFVIIDFP
jgi:hypothetical protein